MHTIAIVEKTPQQEDDKRRAPLLLTAVSGNWTIKDQVQWVLNLAFSDDQSQEREGHVADNVAAMRHLALNRVVTPLVGGHSAMKNGCSIVSAFEFSIAVSQEKTAKIGMATVTIHCHLFPL